jgi:hypothetical protein
VTVRLIRHQVLVTSSTHETDDLIRSRGAEIADDHVVTTVESFRLPSLLTTSTFAIPASGAVDATLNGL